MDGSNRESAGAGSTAPSTDTVVRVDEDALGRLSPQISELLGLLQTTTTALTRLFGELAANPSRYASVRAELDQLDGERSSLLRALGEHATRFIVVAPNLAKRDEHHSVGPADWEPDPDDWSEPADSGTDEGDSAQLDREVPPPASNAPSVGAPPPPPSATGLRDHRLVYSSAPSARTQAGAERSVLMSLAQFVEIADQDDPGLRRDDEVDALEQATSSAREGQWKKLSPPTQVRWLSVLVAWGKALEQETAADGFPSRRASDAFRRLRGYSIRNNPGFIHGFARDAEPRHGSWRADACALLGEIKGSGRTPTASSLVPAESSRKAPPPPAPLEREAREDDDNDVGTSAIPNNWPYLERVRGRVAVMLGGDVREDRRLALQRAFQFKALEWVPHNRPRLVESLAERARQGTVDIVLVNKMVAHKETAALERQSTAPIVMVRRGYGVTAVRAALEAYFGRGNGTVTPTSDA